MPEQTIPFLNLFTAWQPEPELRAVAGDCVVHRAVVDRAARVIRAEVEWTSLPDPTLVDRLERAAE